MEAVSPSQPHPPVDTRIRTSAVSPWLAAFVFFTACSNAFLEPLPKNTSSVDDLLSLRGTVCTEPPDPSNFPVKVVFIVDQSGSMCISDPPGSQGMQTGLCEQFCSLPGIQANLQDVPGCATNNPKPGRVQALLDIVQQFRTINAKYANPPISITILPFETNVSQSTWPGNDQFQAPDGPGGSTDTFIEGLQTQLGNGTDYQGVLDYAKTLITSDVLSQSQQALPRTRYVVVFLTDGTPYPRCTANPNLPNSDYANYDPFNHPELTWEDDPMSYCETATGNVNDPMEVHGYVAGTDRNQNYQIFDLVDSIMALKQEFNIGDINFDTVLLLNAKAVEDCGLICQDVYGAYPGLSPAQFSQATLYVASWLLQSMSNRANGVFQAFTNGQIASLSLGGLDYTSLASQNVMKNFYVQSMTSIPTPSGRVFDSDGDGLPDTVDNNFTAGTSPFNPDSDSDCFDDLFEVNHKTEGFNPTVPDPRGCLQGPPACVCQDTDGDGLSNYAEAYLGTNPGIMDSDFDGIPDGLEIRYGFNPLTHHDFTMMDTDGDGVSDWAEFQANTDPTVADAELGVTDGYRYQFTATQQASGAICYDYLVSNIRMLTTPSASGLDGYNLYKLYFDEAPQSILDKDYGVWHAACAWGQYSPPGFRVPAGPELDLTQGNWVTPDKLIQYPIDYLNRCAGTPPQ